MFSQPIKPLVVFLPIMILLSFACDKKTLSSSPDFKPRTDDGRKPDPQGDETKKVKLAGLFVDINSAAIVPDGSSWQSAFSSIQEAIDKSTGEPIIVAAGTYNSPKLVIRNKKNVKLIGGYQAGEEYERKLDVKGSKDVVILDGQFRPNSLLTIAEDSENISVFGVFVFKNVVGKSAVNIVGSPDRTIKNIEFAHSRFENNAYAAGLGGGLNVGHARQLRLQNVDAKQNRAKNGGFLAVVDSSELHIEGGNWLSNTAIGDGVAISKGGTFYGININTASFSPNLVSQGRAHEGAGIYLFNVENIDFKDTVFSNNHGPASDALNEQGAALFIKKGSNVNILRNSWLANKVKMTPGSMGGAISLHQIKNSLLDLDGGELSQNSANLGGAVYLNNSENLKISRAKLLNNEAIVGGALVMDSCKDISLNKNTFTDNKSNNLGAVLLLNNSGSLVLSESSFTNNETRAGNGGALALMDQQDENSWQLNGLSFINNRAQHNGGAIYADNLQGLVQIYASRFEKNQAVAGFGGALALDGKTNQKAKYQIAPGNEFIENKAGLNAGGGAIFLTLEANIPEKPQLVLENSSTNFVGNEAGDKSLGNIIRISSHLIGSHDPVNSPPLRINPSPFGVAPLYLNHFVTHNGSFNFSKESDIYIF